MSHLIASDVPMVDVNIPRFNQAVVALLTGLGFVLQAEALVAVAFALLLASRLLGPRRAPLTALYVRVVGPRLQPDGPTEFEDARPPAFSQWLGVAFTGAALVAFIVGFTVIGWALAVIVAVLATLAAAARICVGCLFYERFVA